MQNGSGTNQYILDKIFFFRRCQWVRWFFHKKYLKLWKSQFEKARYLNHFYISRSHFLALRWVDRLNILLKCVILLNWES